MKSQMSYKAKRNAIIIAIVAILVVLISIGSVVYFRSNNESQAMAEFNGTSETQAGEDTAKAEEPVQNEGEEPKTEEPVNEEEEEPEENTDDTVVVSNNNGSNNNVTENSNDNNNRGNTTTQTITTTETIETTNTVVGFETEGLDADLNDINADITNLESILSAETNSKTEYVIAGEEITYNISLKNNNDRKLEGINVSILVPEGTELVEDTISNDGKPENGAISWKVDIDKELTLSFTVKVTKTSGEITAAATVDGKNTNTVTNIIDEAPVLTVVDPNKYQMEVGTEYQEKGYSAIDKEDGDITDKVVLTYRFQAKDAPTWEDPDPTELDTNRLGTYKITYTVTDSRGNTVKATRVVEIVDTQAPEIIVKDGEDKNGQKYTIGTEPYFSRVSFSLHDNTLLKEFEINGHIFNLTPNAWSDANYDAIEQYLIEGENTLIVRDTSGNEAKYTFTYDITKPEIIVKDGVDNNGEEFTIGTNPYSRVSFSLHDTVLLKEYEINGNVCGLTPNTWSDANFNNIKQYLVEGENTIVLRDMAGNEEKLTFIYDITAPTRVSTDYYVTGKTANVQEIDGNKYQFFYATNGDKLVLNIKFKEELAEVPTFTLIDSQGTEYVLEAENSGLDSKGSNTYTARYNIAEDEAKLAEGEIAFRISNIVDIAGNVAEDVTATTNGRRVIYDRTMPEISIEWTEGFTVGNEPYFSKVSFKFFDNIGVKEYEINGNVVPLGLNQWSNANYDNFKQYLKEGKNVIILRDMAGNEAEYEFYYDNTPARRSATNLLVYGDKNENKIFYAKIGDTIQAYISFNEKLAHNPTFTLINDGKEYEVDSSLVTENEKDGKYIYQILYKIEENTEFVNGEITLKITNLEDMYGNKIEDETKPTNGHRVFFDKTAPVTGEAGFPLYILNRDDENHRKYIGDGKYLRVEANFDEELAENPILTIGSEENTQTVTFESRGKLDNKYVYVADIKLDNSILKLEDGEEVPFTVTNVKDMAGNESTFNNSNVTYTDKYGQVTYDNTAPEYYQLGILNKTHYLDGGNIEYAINGDEVRVLVSFKEKLAVAPKIKVNNDFELNTVFAPDTSTETLFYYMADFTITEEMELPEGEIQIEVYGYEDAAGNKGEKLTNTNINRTDYTKVIYDKTAPKATFVKIQNSKDPNTTWAKEGEDVWVYVKIDEKLSVEPTFTIAGKEVNIIQREELQNGYKYAALLKMTEDIAEGNIEFKVSGYTDVAGNVGEDITVTTDGSKIIYDRTAPEIKPSYWTKDVEADKTVEEFTDLPTVEVSDNLCDKENITLKLTDNIVDMGKVGNYFIRYQAIDEAGNVASNKIFINVVDTTIPTFTPSYWTKEIEADKTATFTEDMYPEVSATDNAEGTPTIEMVNNTVNMGVPGKYKLQYVTTDANGNKAYNDIFITVVDTTNPVFHPSYWKKTVEADKTKEFTEFPEVSATDNAAGDIVIERVKNEVNMGVPGEYKIGYKITDANGNTIWHDIFITVEDTTAPEISLKGDETVKVEINTEYNEEGLNIYDNAEPEPTLETKVYYSEDGKDGTWTAAKDNKVDTSKLGYYNIWYIVTDASGNHSETRRQVIVEDTIAPEISLKGDEYMTVEKGTEFVDPGLNIYDNSELETTTKTKVYYSEDGKDGTWTAAKDNKVDTSKLGYYNIWYIVTDTVGNNSEIRRQVKVQDTIAPEATTVKIQNNTPTKHNDSYAKVGDEVWVYAIFNEKLSVEPTFTIAGKQAEIIQRENGEAKDQTWYKYAAKVTMTEEMAEGNIEFKVSGYADLSGNVGKDITETTDGTNIVFDRTSPKFDNLKDGDKAESVSLGVTDKNFDYILIKNNDTGAEWKESRSWTSFGLEGNYTVIAYDKAGNTTGKYTFSIYVPVASTNINGNEVRFETFKELFNSIPDNSTTKVTIINDTNEDIVIPENKNIELDLNGKTLSGNKTITNNGTISIKNGTIESDNNAIINNGTIAEISNVTVNSERTGINNKGTIEKIADSNIEARLYPISLTDAKIGVLSNNEVTGHYQSGIYLTGNSTIEKIESGTYTTLGDRPTSGNSVAGFGLYIGSKSTVEEIAGGTFKGNKCAVANYGTIELISGGTFEKKYDNDVWAVSDTFLYSGTVKNITGGIFYSHTNQVSGIFTGKYSIEEGYEFVNIEEGYFKVVKS